MHDFLLTGSTGFLGKICLDVISRQGFSIAEFRSLFPVKVDISKEFEFSSDLIFDTVIHVAGKAHCIPKTQHEEKIFFDVNYGGTVNLCSAIERLHTKPKSFIFISTVAVYGVDSGEKIDENHPLNGNTAYAKSKILAERYLDTWAKENNIILTVLRLPLIAGPNPPGNLGKMIDGIISGKYLSIGNATARKSMVWAADIGELIPVLLKKGGGIYNLSDGHHPSFSELETMICKRFNKQKPMKIPFILAKLLAKVGDLYGERFPINTSRLGKISSTLTFDDARAREKLDWRPSSVLDELSNSL
jgi:GlcNAc-P-P-Und epimerase